MYRQWIQRSLQKLFMGYLGLLERTITIEWKEMNHYETSQIFGFWHEDSFFMNLVLKKLSAKTGPVDVIVTADTRGDYITAMVEKCGGHALRVPDGYQSFSFLRKLVRNSYESTRSLAVALDGPLGPRHEPKKLAFYLSSQAQEEFVGIFVTYSAALRLFWRWDHYAIPLPFSHMTVEVRNYGEVDKKQIPNLPFCAEIEYTAFGQKDEEKVQGRTAWRQITF